MFTGLIADTGVVEGVEAGAGGARLRIRSALAVELSAGDSVAVNGACLTAASVNGEVFEADVINQTLEHTSLGPLRAGDRVNLELPLRAADRLGGHIVQGHVDGTGEVAEVSEDGFARRLVIEVPEELRAGTHERHVCLVELRQQECEPALLGLRVLADLRAAEHAVARFLEQREGIRRKPRAALQDHANGIGNM